MNWFRECLCVDMHVRGLTIDKSASVAGTRYLDRVAAPENFLEVLGGANAAQPAADHYPQPIADSFTLLHAMRREDHAARLRERGNDLPHGPVKQGRTPAINKTSTIGRRSQLQ